MTFVSPLFRNAVFRRVTSQLSVMGISSSSSTVGFYGGVRSLRGCGFVDFLDEISVLFPMAHGISHIRQIPGIKLTDIRIDEAEWCSNDFQDA